MPSPAVSNLANIRSLSTNPPAHEQHNRAISPVTPPLAASSSAPPDTITSKLAGLPLTEHDSSIGAGSTADYQKPNQTTIASVSANRSTTPSSAMEHPKPIQELSTSTLKEDIRKSSKVLDVVEEAKRLAAYTAVDRHVKPEHKVVGIGSGSTVPYVVDRIISQGPELNQGRWFIPTGFQSKELIVKAGLHLGDVDQFPVIDITIDGADEVDSSLNVIKGGGACHLREKVLAEAALEFIVVADHRKNSKILGQSWTQGVPIEVIPFAWSKVFSNLKTIPGVVTPVLRMGKAKAGPVVTDNGNFVIDCVFDETHMRTPEDLLHKIKMLTGVVEVGLFCGMAKAAYFGNADGSVSVRWDDGQLDRIEA